MGQSSSSLDKSKGVESCPFCAILNHEPEKLISRNDRVAVFNDRSPASTYHFQVVPIEHIPSVKSLKPVHTSLVDEMWREGLAVLSHKTSLTTEEVSKDVLTGFHYPPLISVGHLHLHVIYPKSRVPLLQKHKYRHDSFFFRHPQKVIDTLYKAKL
ncbi:adenosine 5'-monophosphoramidase HINT3-like isoform X2 [Convolutriloba macropyga]|uniref:adenosine 5'-monophosphoramidase HINT3-like isoform X1 n=1 Tax=Convolutriloba macropyga TaxID=536237 RepID=UPI003F51C2BE